MIMYFRFGLKCYSLKRRHDIYILFGEYTAWLAFSSIVSRTIDKNKNLQIF